MGRGIGSVGIRRIRRSSGERIYKWLPLIPVERFILQEPFELLSECLGLVLDEVAKFRCPPMLLGELSVALLHLQPAVQVMDRQAGDVSNV